MTWTRTDSLGVGTRSAFARGRDMDRSPRAHSSVRRGSGRPRAFRLVPALAALLIASLIVNVVLLVTR